MEHSAFNCAFSAQRVMKVLLIHNIHYEFSLPISIKLLVHARISRIRDPLSIMERLILRDSSE